VNNYGYLGVVNGGRFEPLAAERAGVAGALRLSTTALHAPEGPESGEIALEPYEGYALMVRGIDSGDWILSAVIVEQAGQLLTAVVRQVFNRAEGQALYGLPTRLS
jgi:hypothetical protein